MKQACKYLGCIETQHAGWYFYRMQKGEKFFATDLTAHKRGYWCRTDTRTYIYLGGSKTDLAAYVSEILDLPHDGNVYDSISKELA